MVDSYKGANLDIANVGKGISELLLVRIDPHRVYENLEFEEDQVCDFTLPQLFQPLREVQCMLMIPKCDPYDPPEGK